jgi:hypothetical protein
MKVKELLEELKDADPEMEVIIAEVQNTPEPEGDAYFLVRYACVTTKTHNDWVRQNSKHYFIIFRE